MGAAFEKHEEDIDADEPTDQPIAARMERHDEIDGDRPKTVEMWAVPECRR